MRDSIEIRAEHVVCLLERYCDTAEDDDLASDVRLRAARSVRAAVPAMRDAMVIRERIPAVMMGRITRVCVLAAELEASELPHVRPERLARTL